MKKIILTVILTLNCSQLMASDPIDAADSLRKRTGTTFVPAHAGPDPDINYQDLPEVSNQCQSTSLWEDLKSGMHAILGLFEHLNVSPWPQLEDMSNNSDGESYSPGQSEMRVSTRISDSPADVIENLDLEDELAEETKTSQFIDHLKRNPKLTNKEILNLIDSGDKCSVALTYLDGTNAVESLNLSECDSMVLPNLIEYMKMNKASFAKLRILLCQGHHLDPQQILDLLTVMTSGPRALPPNVYLDLTPGPKCKPIILMALAARFANKYPLLKMGFTGISPPEGYMKLLLHRNIRLVRDLSYKGTERDQVSQGIVLLYMERIVNGGSVEVSYGDKKTLRLEN
jgi:hypothetical protein